MTDAKAEFALSLKDEMSDAAASMEDALVKLKGELDSDVRALGEMQKAMRNLKSGGVSSGEAFDKLSQQIVAQQKTIAQSQAGYVSLGGTFAKTSSSGGGMSSRLRELTEKTGKLGDAMEAAKTQQLGSDFSLLARRAQLLPGPLGGVVSRLGALRELVNNGGKFKIGIGLIVTALAALVAALGVAIAKMYKFGIAMAEARRNEHLQLEGLTKLRFWYQRVAGNADEMQASLDKVSASSALGRDELNKYQNQLYMMGLRGKNLGDALEGVAIKASVQGDAAASRFMGWAATMNMAGGSVRKLTDDVKARLGGIAQRQMLSSEVQAKKLQEAHAALFSGLKIEKYLQAWKDVNDLQTQSTASGRALKQIMEVVLQPLIDASTEGAPILKRFFQGVILETQQLVIAFLRVRLWWKNTIGSLEFGGIRNMRNAFVVARVLTLALALGFAFLAGWVIAATWPFLLAGVAIWGLINTVSLLVELWEEIDWKGMGTAVWQGIVDGLKGAGGAIAQVATDLAGELKNAFKQALGISSPSREFMRLGLEIPAGVEQGIKQGAPGAQSAADSVVTPNVDSTTARGSGAAGASSSSSRGAPTISIDVGGIHVHSSESKPDDVAADVERRVEALFERIALQLGARVSGAA